MDFCVSLLFSVHRASFGPRGLVDDEAAFLCIDFCPVCGDAAHSVGIILLERHVQEGVAVEFRRGETVFRIQHVSVVHAIECDGVDAPSVVGRDADGARLAVFGFHFHASAFRLLHREGDGDFREGDFYRDGVFADFHVAEVLAFGGGAVPFVVADGDGGLIARLGIGGDVDR